MTSKKLKPGIYVPGFNSIEMQQINYYFTLVSLSFLLNFAVHVP